MSSFKIFDIAGSGMSAQSVRLNTTASNLANADSVSGDPNQVYKAKHPLFEAIRAASATTRPPPAFGEGSTRTRLRRARATSRAIRSPTPMVMCTRPTSTRRGDGQHDLGVALVPEQPRSDEHRQGDDAGDAAARPVISLIAIFRS